MKVGELLKIEKAYIEQGRKERQEEILEIIDKLFMKEHSIWISAEELKKEIMK